MFASAKIDVESINRNCTCALAALLFNRGAYAANYEINGGSRRGALQLMVNYLHDAAGYNLTRDSK